MRVLVTYDARPMAQEVQYDCIVKKFLKSGFKLQCAEADTEKSAKFEKYYGDVIFTNDGRARGWNTLTWKRNFG